MTVGVGLERRPLAGTAIGGSLIIVGLYQYSVWVTVTAATVMVAVATVQVHNQSAFGWTQQWARHRFGRVARARALVKVPAVRDIVVPGGVCGIRDEGATLVAMIQLAPNLDLPTVIADESTYTEDTVPVADLLDMLDQYGIAIDIDIVTTGQRVRSASSYGMLYDQLIGSHPVIGNRLTWLVVRLDQMRNLSMLARRGPASIVGPKALATAAHRIASMLRQRGIAAHALPAGHLREATRLLHAGVELTDLRETWDRLVTSVQGRCVTSYWIDPARLDSETLDDCWSWHSDHTTLTISLTADAGPEVRAVVRFIGAPPRSTPSQHLRPLPGRQTEAMLASLPAGVSLRALGVGSMPAVEIAADLKIPIGPSGQILGVISGRPRHVLALPLYDPARFNPRRRTIDVQAQLAVAQQIVLRAAVVGADIEIHTSRPHRWRQLVAAVGDSRTLRLAQDQSTGIPVGSATIAVFDHLAPTATTASTVITVSEPGGRSQTSANLAISQVSAKAVNVSIPMHTVRVDLIEPVGETRYLEQVSSPSTGNVEHHVNGL